MGLVLKILSLVLYFVSFHTSAATSCQSVFKLLHPDNLMVLTEDENSVLKEAFQVRMADLETDHPQMEAQQILGDIIQNHKRVVYVYNGFSFEHGTLHHVHLQVPYKERTYIDEIAIKIWKVVGSLGESFLHNSESHKVRFDTGRSDPK